MYCVFCLPEMSGKYYNCTKDFTTMCALLKSISSFACLEWKCHCHEQKYPRCAQYNIFIQTIANNTVHCDYILFWNSGTRFIENMFSSVTKSNWSIRALCKILIVAWLHIAQHNRLHRIYIYLYIIYEIWNMPCEQSDLGQLGIALNCERISLHFFCRHIYIEFSHIFDWLCTCLHSMFDCPSP